MKKFVKGDWDGFFALGLDNLIMLLLMGSLCLGPLGFTPEFFYTTILPANAVGLLIGNLFYARQARKLALAEGRNDVCALPYGINLFTILIFSFGVMLPARLGALQMGKTPEEAQVIAWHAGLIACLVSGLIEFAGSFVAGYLRRWTPRAALLSALAGIGLVFLGGLYFFRAYSFPWIGMSTLAITFVIYFGRVRFKWGLPAGLVILGVGTGIAWLQHAFGQPTVVPVSAPGDASLGLHLPVPVLGDIWEALDYWKTYLPVAITMGFLSLIGSLMNLESAAAAGDSYKAKPALAFNGLGSIATACFGSPYPTTIYIGHPGWKALGARAGYSTINAVFFTIVLCTGLLWPLAYAVPIEAGIAILIWIGLVMTIQCFRSVPEQHHPAVAVGLLPALGAFAYVIMMSTWGALGFGGGGDPLPEDAIAKFHGNDLFAEGIFALNSGYIYTSLILTAVVVYICERRFYVACGWALAGAVLSLLGFMHGFKFDPGGYTEVLGPAWKWFAGYLVLAGILALTPLITKPASSPS